MRPYRDIPPAKKVLESGRSISHRQIRLAGSKNIGQVWHYLTARGEMLVLIRAELALEQLSHSTAR
jgi:hypothetical protein